MTSAILTRRQLLWVPPTAALAATFLTSNRSLAQEGISLPAPALDAPSTSNRETAVFAGGCFWGVQGVFQHVTGVISATSGYAGGHVANPSYEQVSSGSTGNAEAVQIVFDPEKISYGRLLQIFFSVAHDPTQLNRQGPDQGTQYRSAVFPASEAQSKVAKAYIAQLDAAHLFDAGIVTKIEPAGRFYPAEGYHQNFLTLNPDYPYIVVNDLPKIRRLKTLFPQNFRADPVLVAVAG
jgi:peptide-methionine (S)-S-oxide reductase